MRLMSRLLSSFFVFTGVLVILSSLSVDWLFELYAPTDRFGNRISLIENQRKGEQLSRELAISKERINAKDVAVDALLDGEISLFEAAACFRSLHNDARTWHNALCPRPAFDDGESWCRLVIDWAAVTVHCSYSDSQSLVVRQRLEAELQEEKQRQGAVRLPD